MNIKDLTDKQLADMVRNCIYTAGINFGDGQTDSQYLLVMAVPYGNDEGVTSHGEAVEAFAKLFRDDDWKERELQVYDHRARHKFYSMSFEEYETNRADEEEVTTEEEKDPTK